MTTDLRSDAERRYDETRLSRQAAADPVVEILEAVCGSEDEQDDDWTEEYQRGFHEGRQSVMGDVQAILNNPDQPLTMRQKFEVLWEADDMPDGNAIYAMLLEDRIASYMWWRCVDWVLYRQRNGMSVLRCNGADDCPAEIDARFKAAQRTYARPGTWPEAVDGHEVSMATAMDDWDRTPEQRAELRRQNELLIKIFEWIEAHAA